RARWDAPVERGFPVGIAEDAVLFMTPPSSATVAVRTEVRAVDAATGRERWVHTIDGPSPTLWTDGQHIVLHQVGSDGDDNTVVAVGPRRRPGALALGRPRVRQRPRGRHARRLDARRRAGRAVGRH